MQPLLNNMLSKTHWRKRTTLQVFGACSLGMLLVRARPRAWFSGSAVLLGLLPKVVSALGKQTRI